MTLRFSSAYTRLRGDLRIKAMPRGQTEHLKGKQYKVKGDRPLAKVPLTVRVPEDVDEYIRSLPDKSAWLQRVLTDAVATHIVNSDMVS